MTRSDRHAHELQAGIKVDVDEWLSTEPTRRTFIKMSGGSAGILAALGTVLPGLTTLAFAQEGLAATGMPSLQVRKRTAHPPGISPYFQDEINTVDPTKTLSFVRDSSTHSPFRYSYDGLTVTAGSDLGCEYGASALLEAMGFRWYTPNIKFWVRPASISTSLTRAKASYWLPNNRVFLVYGHQFDMHYLADRTTLNDAFRRWATLNGVWTSSYPAGHRWGDIIESNLTFFEANPQLIIGRNALITGAKFDLSVTGDDYTNLVNICAAHILSEGLDQWNRSHFDPADGDTQASDLVFPFAKAVADKVRSGTDVAIGGIPPQAGVPDAELGIYAYAGHRRPPAKSVAPSVYTQVALGFNDTELSYQELVEMHGAKSAAISIREYHDTQVWSKGRPNNNSRMARGYYERYDAFVAAGAKASVGEFAAHWLINIVGMRYGLQKFKTGTYNWDDALNEITADLFGGDPAVRSLYELWGDPSQAHNKYTLRLSFEHVAAMNDEWYRGYFISLMVILAKFMYLPSVRDRANYPVAFTSLMKNIVAVRLDDILHTYAFIRQDGARVRTHYPDLKWNASPRPDWFNNPTPPTPSEFAHYLADLQAETVRDPDLDDEDLVLVQGIVPTVAATTPADRFMTKGRAIYKYVGPGKVTFRAAGSNGAFISGGHVTEESYGAGLHTILAAGDLVATNQGGELFLKAFPSVSKEPDGSTSNHWLYIPTRFAGAVDLRAAVRVTLFHADGKLKLYPVGHESYYSPINIAPGQIRISNALTTGSFEAYSAGPYISKSPTLALLPRAIAQEDFPGTLGKP